MRTLQSSMGMSCDRQHGAPEINLPVELSPGSGVSGFLHRMVKSGDVPDVPGLIGGHSCSDQRPAVAVLDGPDT
jgi:hypothetical protein